MQAVVGEACAFPPEGFAELADTKIRFLKKSVASKVKRPEDIPVTGEAQARGWLSGDYVLSWNEKTGRQTV